MRTITTDTGTSVTLRHDRYYTRITVDHPNAPEDMRDRELGRVVNGHFQGAPFMPVALAPATLRAIADLLDAPA